MSVLSSCSMRVRGVKYATSVGRNACNVALHAGAWSEIETASRGMSAG